MKRFPIHFILLSLALFGCQDERPKQAAEEPPTHTQEFRGGDATIVVTLSETNLLSSGKVILAISARAPSGTAVVIPDIHPFIEPFAILNSRSEPPRALAHGETLHRRVWTLAPPTAGEVVFQPIEVEVDGHVARSAPIQLEVTSRLPADVDGLELRDIAERIEPEPDAERKRRSLYSVIGALLVVILLPVIVILAKRSKDGAPPLPRDEALRALAELPTDPVARVHELNHIFRAYHEGRFNIPMLGRTGVELSAVLDDTEILQFLERCDAIRFSNKAAEAFAPEAERFVRAHIDATPEEPECD